MIWWGEAPDEPGIKGRYGQTTAREDARPAIYEKQPAANWCGDIVTLTIFLQTFDPRLTNRSPPGCKIVTSMKTRIPPAIIAPWTMNRTVRMRFGKARQQLLPLRV